MVAPGVSLGSSTQTRKQPQGGVRMAHTFTNLLTHVVFSTSGRAPHLDDNIRSDAHAYMGGILRELNIQTITIGGTSDHVHLLFRLRTDLTLADSMRLVKTNSSRWFKERWPHRRTFAWQGGYGAFSVSQSNRSNVIRYIQNQPEHHRRISYEGEFVTLLKRHAVQFDEQYLWR